MELELKPWKNGSVSIRYGPLYYSLKIQEQWQIVKDAGQYHHPNPHLWENYEVLPVSDWNFGLYSADGSLSAVSVRVKEIKERIDPQPWNCETAPVILEATVRRIPEWKLQDDTAAPLQASPAFTEEKTQVRELIPLGCARLRISCFPIATDDGRFSKWNQGPDTIPLEKRPQKYPDPYL